MSDNIINLQYTTIKDPLPDFIYKGLEEYSKNANGYKPQPKDLVDRLAKNHNVPSEMIFLTAGADEAIQMFIHAYGTNTYAFSPTYVVYSDAKEFGNLPVPLHLRNAVTKLMKGLGYGKGYQYAHDYEEAKTDLDCLPDELKGRKYL